MKRILLICVNYNSYDALKEFLESADCAASYAKNECSVRVWIADNSSQKQVVFTSYRYIDCSYFACTNNGYLGSVETILQQNNWSEAKNADFLIISNVDIYLSKDTFVELCKITDPDIGWIAPRIYSSCRNTEESPQAIHRYSKWKLRLLLLLNSFPLLFKWYRQSLHVLVQRNRNHKTSHNLRQQEIYAGNGSIFIFTKSFISLFVPFHYPLFLYGEENYFAELVRKCNLKTMFYPNIYIENKTPNVSTKELNLKQRCSYNKNAIKYILKTFY